MPVQMDYSGFTFTNGTTRFTFGDTVYVNGEGDYRGKICYIGDVHFAKGEFAGVALDHPVGYHDGSHRGRRYFQCLPNHGVFARTSKITKIPLIPATNDSSRCGLWRESPPPRSISVEREPRVRRESSPLSSVGSIRSRYSKSPSPTPSNSSGSNNLYSDRKYRANSSGDVLRVGERVIVGSSVGETKTGILRYIGPVEFASGEWAGIELFHPLGKNDGTVRGRYYFTCAHPYGLFVPSYKVESSPANKLGNRLIGSKANIDRVLQYSSLPRTARAGSYDDDFY